MEKESGDVLLNSAINLMKWEELVNYLRKSTIRKGWVNIDPVDVFRITKMMYKDNYLILFLSGYVSDDPDRLYQFYAENKCDLYSYRMCYKDHASNVCFNKCQSYKAFVMPGVPGVYTHKHNIIKYKRDNNSHKYDKNCLDNFMRDVNRVHMQTDFIEGQYVRFKTKQKCLNNRLKCFVNDVDAFKDIFEVVNVESLTREILPVIACYDIETHSNGQRFSSAMHDHVMSIGVVCRRDKKSLRMCLYYNPNCHGFDRNLIADKSENNIVAVKFESEISMLTAFFDLLPLLNIDYLLDYNGDKFDLPFIIDRIKILSKTPMSLMKIRRYDLPPVDIDTQQLCDKFNNKLDNHLFTYYIHVDLYQFLSSDVEFNDVENFQLNTVAEHYLKQKKKDLKISDMLQLYNEGEMKEIILYNVQDCVLPIELFVKLEIMDFLYSQCMLLYLCTDDLLKNISHKISLVFFYSAINNTKNINGQAVADPYFFNKYDLTVTSGRKRSWQEASTSSSSSSSLSTSVDYNESTSAGSMVDLTQLCRKPIPVSMVPSNSVKLCAATQNCVYKGGKVLSPVPGYKKWVITLDFNSLYPTIMMYEGVCLTNVCIAEDNNVYLVKNLEAITPKLLRNLLELRSKYKTRRDQYQPGTFQYNLYDKTQNAVKRIANSIYGYFGIFFKVLANYITKIGRSKLSEAIKKIEAMSDNQTILSECNLSTVKFQVIYGDTDSSFIQVGFNEDEIAPDQRFKVIGNIVSNYVLKQLNGGWVGYKMALENIIPSLILLKKKKYCYLNTDDRIKYKGWLVKKDMPLFMRKTFRTVVDSYLRDHSVACGLNTLADLMIKYYQDFGKDLNSLSDYSFSMSYNENPTKSSKKKNDNSTNVARKAPITIAKHCREILASSGVDFLPGTGDRIPYLLIDIKEKITQKAYPLKLFNPQSASHRISWLKHMSILCNFMNELMFVFGDRDEFEYYFRQICSVYMSKQVYDVKYPVLTPLRKSNKLKKINNDDVDDDDDLLDHDIANNNVNENNDDDDEDDEENSGSSEGNCNMQFSMYVRKPKCAKIYFKKPCPECQRMC